MSPVGVARVPKIYPPPFIGIVEKARELLYGKPRLQVIARESRGACAKAHPRGPYLFLPDIHIFHISHTLSASMIKERPMVGNSLASVPDWNLSFLSRF